MKNTIFKGSGVALVTPMDNEGNVNYNVLGELLEFQLQNETDAIIVCGTTGESATLSEEEHNKVTKYAIEKVKGKVPVIVGTGSNNTKIAIEKSKNAQALGANALLVVTPYYNKTSQRGIVEYYDSISKNVDIPIIVYNVPSRTGVNIKPETYAELAKRDNIVAVKEASGDISAVAKTISLCKDDLMVYSGNDDSIVPVLSLGGIGVISVLANICPKETHNIVSEYLKGNISYSRELQIKFLPLIEALFSDVNPIPIKEALNLMGFPCGACREPLVPMEERLKENLRNKMIDNSLL